MTYGVQHGGRGCSMKRPADRFSGARSSSGSTSSTPPTCIPSAPARGPGPRAAGIWPRRDERGDRHQGLQPDGRRSQRSRAVAQAHHARHRRSLRRLQHRLCRPLPDPPLRPRRRPSRRRWRRSRRRAGGQSALHRRVVACTPGNSRSAALADRHGWTRFVSMQNHYNLVYREEEREMLPLCRHEGIGVIPWSPLAARLSGRQPHARRGQRTPPTREETDDIAHNLYYADADYDVAERVTDVARDRGVTPAQNRARVAAAAAWRDGPDRRRQQAGTPRTGRRRVERHAVRRGCPAARGTVRAAHGADVAMRRLLTSVLLALILPVAALAQSGTLVVVGGGNTGPDIVSRTLELAGGKNAIVAVLPQSSAGARCRRRLGDDVARGRGALGREGVVRRSARRVGGAERATLIWMPGGDQTRFMKAIDGTGWMRSFAPAIARASGGRNERRRGGHLRGDDYRRRRPPVAHREKTVIAKGLGLWPRRSSISTF